MASSSRLHCRQTRLGRSAVNINDAIVNDDYAYHGNCQEDLSTSLCPSVVNTIDDIEEPVRVVADRMEWSVNRKRQIHRQGRVTV